MIFILGYISSFDDGREIVGYVDNEKEAKAWTISDFKSKANKFAGKWYQTVEAFEYSHLLHEIVKYKDEIARLKLNEVRVNQKEHDADEMLREMYDTLPEAKDE